MLARTPNGLESRNAIFLSSPLGLKELATERNEASGSKKEDTEDMWAPEAVGKTKYGAERKCMTKVLWTFDV